MRNDHNVLPLSPTNSRAVHCGVPTPPTSSVITDIGSYFHLLFDSLASTRFNWLRARSGVSDDTELIFSINNFLTTTSPCYWFSTMSLKLTMSVLIITWLTAIKIAVSHLLRDLKIRSFHAPGGF